VDDHLLGAEWPIFGGFTRDPAGNYYVLTAKENRDGDFSSNLRLAKYGPNLKKSAVCDLPTGKGDGFDVMSPLAVSTGRLAADSGHVYIHIGKAMHKYIDGLNHQSGIQVAVRTKDMKVDMAASMKSTASHSFD